MDHETLKEKVRFYKDPETPEAERLVLTTHLESCEECRNALKQWEQVQTKFTQTALKPSSAFVFQVMERLEPQEKEASALTPGLFPSLLRWLFPALGYSFALALMFVVITHREMPVNTEAILLADLPHASQWTLGNQTPDAGDLLDM